MFDHNRLKQISITLFILSLVMLIFHMESMIRFNRHEVEIHGNDDSEPVRMEIDARADSTSTWLKRDFQMDDGSRVDLTGQTIDGTLLNQSKDTIQDWELQINILGDCYINQAWNGEVEIHQFVGTDREKVQRMNLQNYRLEDVPFEYRYDGDLLIPLQKGDYVLYYPNAQFSEMPIDGKADAKIGVIFYYLDDLDLSDYDLHLHFHRTFTQGITFYIFIVLSVLWILCMTLNGAGMLAYRRAMKEMELRKSGIFSMSDIYDFIYIIHLPDGEMTPVSVDEKMERDRPKNMPAKELLSNMVMQDTEEKYQTRMLKFVDTDTLPDRLKNRNSVAIEFQSRQYGWCSIRFCAIDRAEGKDLEHVVFTMQNIDEERREQEAMLHQIEEAESINEAKASFVDNIANDLQRPLESLVRLNGKILRECRDDAVKDCARSANSAANRLLVLTQGLVDGFAIEAGKKQDADAAYSLRQLLTDILQAVLPLAEENGFTLTLDAAESLPDQLLGDSRILREILINLISGSLSKADSGRLQLSVYGKPLDDRIHLLFSVRIISNSTKTQEISGLVKEVVSSLLTGIGSDLKSVRSPAGRSESYFEIEQKVLDAAPIGRIAVDEI